MPLHQAHIRVTPKCSTDLSPLGGRFHSYICLTLAPSSFVHVPVSPSNQGVGSVNVKGSLCPETSKRQGFTRAGSEMVAITKSVTTSLLIRGSCTHLYDAMKSPCISNTADRSALTRAHTGEDRALSLALSLKSQPLC